MSLTTLPTLPLEKITSYLNFSSLVNLAATTSSLAHLQPKKQLVIGKDFSVPGLCSRSWHSDSDSDSESDAVTDPNFDVEVKTQGLLGIKIVWECKGKWVKLGCWDMNRGNSTRAQLWLQLVREDKVLEECIYEGGAPVDKYQRQEIFEEEHPVIRRAHRGDLIRVIRYVPDRHGLKVRAFQITLFHKSPVVDKDEDSEGGNCFEEPKGKASTADNPLTEPAKDVNENQKEEESDKEDDGVSNDDI